MEWQDPNQVKPDCEVGEWSVKVMALADNGKVFKLPWFNDGADGSWLESWYFKKTGATRVVGWRYSIAQLEKMESKKKADVAESKLSAGERLRKEFERWCRENYISTWRVPSTGAYMYFRAIWCWRAICAVTGIKEYE